MESSQRGCSAISCPDAGPKLTEQGVSCELRTLAASQVGALAAFLLAMAFFVGQAWSRATGSHKQFLDVFIFIFIATTLYFFVMEWAIEEDEIDDLRNLDTPQIWLKSVSAIRSILTRPFAYFLLFLALIFSKLTLRHVPSFHQLAEVGLASSISLLLAPFFLALVHTFPRLEYLIRVLVVLTLVASIGIPPEWIPIFHNPIDWGFIVMASVYFLFLLWDAIVVLGHPSQEIPDSFFCLFIIDSVAGSLLLLGVWGHINENIDMVQFSLFSLIAVLAIAVLYPAPKTVHLLSRLTCRAKLR
jgi:hypothetical protein